MRYLLHFEEFERGAYIGYTALCEELCLFTGPNSRVSGQSSSGIQTGDSAAFAVSGSVGCLWHHYESELQLYDGSR